MKILVVAQEPALERLEVASGNAVRLEQLVLALGPAGHELIHVRLAGSAAGTARAPGTFRNRDELQAVLLATQPDLVLLTYWELARLLPFRLQAPVVLDFVAPRPLEELYEHPETVRASMRRLLVCLQRSDLVLVGNAAQRHLLINNLIQAGFDLRRNVPVEVVPLGAPVAGPPLSQPGTLRWTLVSGGVSWPWRNSESYMRALSEAARQSAHDIRLVQFGGAYRWHESGEQPPAAGMQHVENRPLQPYAQFSDYLRQHAHIGVELADWNVERAYSQSFRSLEFLRHGLPLICNRYLPIAGLIERFDAGWIVDRPDQLAGLLDSITSAPETWQQKSAGALKLVEQELQPDKSVAPLLNWLKAPVRAQRLPPDQANADRDPVLGVPPLRQRLLRQARLVRQVLLTRLFGQEKAGPGVLFVTRGDLVPADHGAAVRTLETARALGQSGIPVGIVTDDPARWMEFQDGQFRPRPYPSWVRLLSLPAPLVKLLHYSKDLPHSNSFLYLPLSDGGFFWRILAAARAIDPGVLQAEFPAYAHPCLRASPLLSCKVVLVEHNVEYERMDSQVAELSDRQYQNLKQIEISLCRKVDAVVCVSDNDRQKLLDDGVHPDLLHTITHGVALADYQAPAISGLRQKYAIPEGEALIVYHGTFTYPPNRQAIQVFADTLLPGLERRGMRAHVLAVGKEPPAVSPHDRIHFTGSVADVAAWLKAADLAVIPLIEGGGTRMKIIECFAAGIAVVSTSKGIEGIPVNPGRQAVVVDDWEEMMENILRLWNQPQERFALAQAGREFAADLDWSHIARQFRTLYNGLA